MQDKNPDGAAPGRAALAVFGCLAGRGVRRPPPRTSVGAWRRRPPAGGSRSASRRRVGGAAAAIRRCRRMARARDALNGPGPEVVCGREEISTFRRASRRTVGLSSPTRVVLGPAHRVARHAGNRRARWGRPAPFGAIVRLDHRRVACAEPLGLSAGSAASWRVRPALPGSAPSACRFQLRHRSRLLRTGRNRSDPRRTRSVTVLPSTCPRWAFTSAPAEPLGVRRSGHPNGGGMRPSGRVRWPERRGD
jgi:hypothetical protein